MATAYWTAPALEAQVSLQPDSPILQVDVSQGYQGSEGTKGEMQGGESRCRNKGFHKPEDVHSDPQSPVSTKPRFAQGAVELSLAGSTLGALVWLLSSGNALLSAWEMELFETDAGFRLPGPRTPSAKHKERGRCWKHICQPALMVSGTSPSLLELLSPTLEEAALSGFNSSWHSRWRAS